MTGPFVVAPPAGIRVRTRLRVSGSDAAVLREVGGYLGSLASGDLAARCAEGRLDAGQRARSRRVRKLDREVVFAVGRGADPYQRGRLPARLP
jgi:hypothetical protein